MEVAAMTIVPLIGAWLAGSVLIASGVLKLGRTERFRAGLPALGMPSFLARSRWFARGFPAAEAVLGLVVIATPNPWSRLALGLTTALFGVFVVIAIRASQRVEKVECECFGGLSNGTITGVTVLRNSVFLAAAGAGLASAQSPASALPSPWLPLAATAVVVTILVLLRNARASRTPAPARASTPAPFPDEPLVLTTFDGVDIALAEFHDPPTHLVFFSADCSSCRTLVARFRWWPHGLLEGDDLQPVLLGAAEDFRLHDEFAPLVPHALYDPQRVVARHLGMTATPGHAYLTREHPLGTGWTAGEAAIEAAVVRPGFFTETHGGITEH
ncbi:hypothetical protein C5C66_01240 [Rathayibacter toxicus]|uniref:Methylamine utilisation protein MauE domain-containing protein n=2 Tax=Rathayibacter toxicus TaxID=145458 RepID=A0A0C5BQS6_9MICO|nr:hypothetical protein TI83_01440 [Rathayibacter toxicus]ALS57214.1 hypothetical protein APU90_05050 [Rathayibacter toxicus]KKM47255.1 hypothetical protein VT73_00775 [Rathayibacter toxicus]PPH25317.1 hypothetical protein C5D17_01195 [Rathayibacter toxicus]PPH61191.1 hypothetical protein C5C93_01215 [Rathayibacter toxicus]